MITWYKQPYTHWVAAHRLETNCISETHLQEWEFWAPHQVPMPGDLASGEGASGAFDFESQWGLCAGSPQDLDKQRPQSWKSHTGFHMHWVPGRNRDSIGIWVVTDCSTWGYPGKTGDDYGLLWERDIGGIIISMCPSRGGNFCKIRPNPLMLRSREHTIMQVGIQPHPSANWLPKDPPRHTAASTPTQWRRPTHQSDKKGAGPSPSNQETYRKLLYQFQPQCGADIRSKRLQFYCLQKGNHSKNLYKMKRQKIITQISEQWVFWRLSTPKEKDFRLMFMKMIQDIGNKLEAKIDNLQETLSKKIKDLRIMQIKM